MLTSEGENHKHELPTTEKSAKAFYTMFKGQREALGFFVEIRTLETESIVAQVLPPYQYTDWEILTYTEKEEEQRINFNLHSIQEVRRILREAFGLNPSLETDYTTIQVMYKNIRPDLVATEKGWTQEILIETLFFKHLKKILDEAKNTSKITEE